jgi:hypothetical protein
MAEISQSRTPLGTNGGTQYQKFTKVEQIAPQGDPQSKSKRPKVYKSGAEAVTVTKRVPNHKKIIWSGRVLVPGVLSLCK